MKQVQKQSFPKTRNIHQLLHLRGEINIATKSESIGKKKFSRKEKHRSGSDCWIEFFKRIESSDLLRSAASHAKYAKCTKRAKCTAEVGVLAF